MPSPDEDARWMQLALDLAAKGEGSVEPNPMVGCVLVDKSGQQIGAGYHARFGEAHAERAAIDNARQSGLAEQLNGATAYVTLEPCCHHGKTPPCTTALLGAGVARVVVAQRDPFPEVAGKGLALLQQAGVHVSVGLAQSAAEQLNAPYLKRIQRSRPWVIAKWAMSLDGKIATRSGDSQWISGKLSRERVQNLRGRVDAIIVGSGTALTDNPLLTARTSAAPLRTALRVVMDSTLRVPLNYRLVETARETPLLLVAGPGASPDKAEQLRALGCQVKMSIQADPQRRLDELLETLAVERAATNVLVEGGGQLLGSLLKLGQIDQCEVFIAPKLIGGVEAPSPVGGLGFAHLRDCPATYSLKAQPSGEDTHISLRVNWEGRALGPG